MIRDEHSFYVAGGTLRHDAQCYVQRQADRELSESLAQGQFCYVLTARQMGKSSLMIRTAVRLREEGAGVAVLDLTAIGQNLSAEQWYTGLLTQIGQQLDLEDELVEFWQEHTRLGPLQRWRQAIREVVLPRYLVRVVIFIDEIDAVRNLPFSTDEFFAGIREFYNRRTEDLELERLTFCLLGVATPSDLIRDTRTTPFNIGQRIELHDFTEVEAAPLARGLGCEEKSGTALLKRILYWTGGHPYLTQRLCQGVAVDSSVSSPEGINHLCEELFFSPRARERDDNLLFVRERMLRSEVDVASLLSLYGQVHRHKRVRDDEANPLISILRLSGITRVQDGCLRVRNQIYSQVFDPEWVKTNMPDAEVRRQRVAFRRGLLRATAVATVIIAVMAALVFFAIKERKDAEQAKAEALSRELAANAIVQLPLDPELSVLLATEAIRLAPTTQADEAVRQSLPESHVQAVLRGHTSYVRSVEFSPDSKFVVTASFDHMARVWEASTGRSVSELRGHTGWVGSATFSPDGKRVVTASWDQTARVWEANTGQCQAELRGHTARVTGASFSPEAKLVVTTSEDRTIRVWEAGMGKELIVLRGHQGAVWGATFSPDGQLIATASADKTARVWDVRTWRSIAQLRGHTDVVGKVAFSPDSQQVMTASDDGTIRIWDAHTGRYLTRLGGHTGGVEGPSFSPDGQLVATANDDGVARVWEVSSGRILKELRGHTSKVWSAVFSPDGKLVVTASLDGTARIWEVSTGQCRKELRGHTSGMDCAATFSPDGKWVATGSEDGTARVWAVSRINVATELRGHLGVVTSAAFSPDGQHIVTGSEDHTARIWEVSTGRSLTELRGHQDWVTGVGFSPDGQYVVTASRDKTARIWAVNTGHSLIELRGHTSWLRDAAFSPDCRYVVTTSEIGDCTARVWEASTGHSLVELRGHTSAVFSAAFSPDGKLVVTASYDGTARIWEVSTGRSLITLPVQVIVRSAAFSPDGQWVVTGNQDTTAQVWEVKTGRKLRDLRGHKSVVNSAAFSPDGRFIVTGSWDGTARVWESSTGQGVALIRGHNNAVTSTAFSPDGRFVVTASADKTARIYACEVCRPLPEVLALARTRVTRSLTPEEREKYMHESPRR